MTGRERLVNAQAALEIVLGSLDQRTSDRSEFQAAQSLRGIIESLKRLAGQEWAKKEIR